MTLLGVIRAVAREEHERHILRDQGVGDRVCRFAVKVLVQHCGINSLLGQQGKRASHVLHGARHICPGVANTSRTCHARIAISSTTSTRRPSSFPGGSW